jgi:hypothetical protein
VSSVPGDIAGYSSNSDNQRRDQLLEKTEKYIQDSAKARDNYISNPLRRTRKGRINPLPKTKSQLRKTGRQERLIQRRNQKLKELREKVINNLSLK